mgnify:CR=1 FL=1
MITLDPAAVADRVLSDIRAGKFGTSAYPVDMSGDDKMTLQELHDAVCGDPVNAGYDPETQSATESKVGIQFDVAAAQPCGTRPPTAIPSPSRPRSRSPR